MTDIPTMRALLTLIETYQEESGGNFASNGASYDINDLFQTTEHLPLQRVKVSLLDWVLDWEPVENEQRVRDADLSVPIIVTTEQGRLLVVDGFHRLVKASREGRQTLPCVYADQKIMLHARLCWDQRIIQRFLRLVQTLQSQHGQTAAPH